MFVNLCSFFNCTYHFLKLTVFSNLWLEDWEDMDSEEELEYEDADTTDEAEEPDAEREEAGRGPFVGAIPITDCLFCPHHSSSLVKNVAHMTKVHSFFIPDIEYLSDLKGLIRYLGKYNSFPFNEEIPHYWGQVLREHLFFVSRPSLI